MLISLLLIFLNYLLFGIDGFYFGKTNPEIIMQPINSSFHITCSINLSETAGLDSSKLSLHYGNYTIDSTQIMVLNASTILYTMINAPLMKRNYTCKLNSTDVVGQTQVMIGHKPGRVSNFKCRSNKWETMVCSFRDMDNTLPTSYKLIYRPNLDTGHYHECQLHSDFRRHRFCNTNTTYLLTRKLIYFKLDSENVLGRFQEEFVIDNFASVIPAPPEHFRVMSTTSRSVELAWKLSAKFAAFPEDFVLQLNVSSEYEDTKHFSFTANSTTEMLFSVGNLKYAYTMYNASIRMRVAISESIEEMWSYPVELTFMTGTRPPDRPPEHDIGGFHINDNHDLVVYWRNMPKNEQNGPGFRYGIESVCKNGFKISYHLAMISNTMAKLMSLRDDEYEVRVYSANRAGISSEKNVMSIPTRQRRLPFPRRLRKFFHNGEYTFEWEAPMGEMIDYTVFWCAAKSEMPNQCEPSQSIDFQRVPRNVTQFKLKSNDTVNFAVSTNSATSTSGMVWVLCTSANSNDIGKVKTVWISRMTSHTIDLQWTVDCVDAAIVRGFNITVCPTESLDMAANNCSELANYQIVNTTTTGIHRHTIENLKPYTMYKVALAMISDTRRGPLSNYHYNRTLEAPPSEPLNLMVREITNVTAELHWDRPAQINGALMYYEIWFNENKIKTVDEPEKASQKHLLENLRSYTDYQILVQACTISCSKASNKVRIRTSVGIPSKIGQLQADGLSDEGDAYIYWQMPDVKAGLLEFFEIKVDMVEAGQTLPLANFKISGSHTACRLPYKTCDDHSKVKEFSIRPVNVLSHSNTPELLDGLKTNHTQGIVDCELNNGAIQALLAKDPSLVLLHGDWSTPLTTHCSFNDEILTVAFISIGIVALLGICVCTFCIYRKIKYMKNIAIILPEGLMDIIEPDDTSLVCHLNKAGDEAKLLPRQNCYEKVKNERNMEERFNEKSVPNRKPKRYRKNNAHILVSIIITAVLGIFLYVYLQGPFITLPSTGEIQSSRPMHVELSQTVNTNPIVYSTMHVTGPNLSPQTNEYVDQRCMVTGSGYVTNFTPTPSGYVDVAKQPRNEPQITAATMCPAKQKIFNQNQLSGYVKPQQLADFGHLYTASYSVNKLSCFCCFLLILCIGGINGIGWTYPSEIKKLVNESFDITCTLNPTITNGSSSNMSFFVGEEEVSRESISIINDTSIKLHVNQAPPMKKLFMCKINDDGVAVSYVIVGFKPGKVSGFKCRSNNWQNMTCDFRQMYNPIATTYNLSFQTTLTMQTFACPLTIGFNQMYSCFLNQTYRPAHETYLFKLVSNNTFDTFTEEFVIDNFASVVLAPPVSIEPKNITDKSVVLEWNISSKLIGFRKDIVHQVKICSEYERDEWKTETLVLPVNGTTYQLKLDNLEFAHTWYDVRIRLRSLKAPDTDEMWSNYTSKTFLTNSRRPDTPPDVDIGGFHINDNRDIVIYWKTLAKAYHNGLNADYRIRQVFENGKLKNRTPDMSASIMARFNHMPDYDYEFMVESVNEKGASINSSVIRVPQKAKRLGVPIRLKKLFIDGEYKLSWSPAINYSYNVDSYTIFWCISKNELPNQCESSINFTHVNGRTHYFNFPTNDTINFAVSANRGNTTSGMVWAMCTAAESNDIGKLKTIWIPKMEPTRMVIQWKLECVDSSIVEGYNLTYCPISSPRNIDCKEPAVSINITGGRDVTKFEIDDLRPYTTYKTLISMFSKTRMGPESEPLVNTTMESSPTPPRNLVARDVRNSSMTLYWDAPLQSNGVLMYYEVWYNGESVRVENEDKSATSMVYVLQNLTSFKEYHILVLACTVACSGNSNELNETTKVGVPGEIVQPSSITSEDNGSDLQIRWAKPTLSAGYIDYYELQIRTTKSNKHIENTTVKILGNFTSCRLLTSICQDINSDKYEFLVRAVNMKLTPHANKSEEEALKFKTLHQRQLNEVSQEIDDGKDTMTQFKRHSNVDNDSNRLHANSYNLLQDTKSMRQDGDYKPQKLFASSNTVWSPSPQIAFMCAEERNENLVRILERDKFAEHLHGEWSKPLVHWCHYSGTGYKQYMLGFLAVSVTVCVVFVMFSVFRKYNRMKDIIIILPAGLEDIIKEDAKLGTIMDTEMQKKQERMKSKAIEYVDEQEEKLLRTREESTSSSNSAGEVNSQCSAGDSVGSQRQNSEETASMHSEMEFEEDAPKPFITHPGTGQKIEAIAPNYIDDVLTSSTPIPPTTATSSSSLAHPTNIITNFPISSNGYVSAPMLMRPATNGYVQHQMMPKAMPQSGYTQVDIFGKPLGTLPQKPETPMEVRNSKLNMKTPIIAQTDEEGISGYVTHKQLSDFGHRLQ